MHEVLFGGISLTDYDRSTNTFIQDNNLPFINQITSVVIDQNGNYSQHLLGEFPQILDQSGNQLRFGAEAQFFLADGVPTYDNGVIKLDCADAANRAGLHLRRIVRQCSQYPGRRRRGVGGFESDFRSRLLAGARAVDDGSIRMRRRKFCLCAAGAGVGTKCCAVCRYNIYLTAAAFVNCKSQSTAPLFEDWHLMSQKPTLMQPANVALARLGAAIAAGGIYVWPGERQWHFAGAS